MPSARALTFALALASCAHHAAATHGDRVPHHVPARQYAAMLDDPARASWQHPTELVAALAIAPGSSVADVGTGSGYFLPELDRAVAPNGSVIAEDIDPELLAIAGERIAREHLAHARTVLGHADDPGLAPASVDLVLIVDTYHHIADRSTFFAHVRASLRPGGRVAIVDFRDGNLPVGPPPGHKLPRAQVEHEMGSFGFDLAASPELLPYQFVLIYTPRSQ